MLHAIRSEKNWKLWIVPMFTVLVLSVFVIGVGVLYNGVQNQLRHQQSATVAKAIALDLIGQVQSVARTLNGVGQFEIIEQNSKLDAYGMISRGLVSKYPGFFYAINFVKPDGVIARVYPIEQNKEALGKDLRTRPELVSYLDESRKNKTAFISHRVHTYQGIYAIIVYEPMHDSQGKFRGWLNAVIDIDNWLRNQIREQGWDDLYIRMQWSNADKNDLILGGKTPPAQTFTYDLPILNQMVKIDVGMRDTSLTNRYDLHLDLMWGVVFFLLMTVTILIYKLTLSNTNLIRVNEQLSVKNILLNSLAHDLASPLASLGLTLEMVVQAAKSAMTDIQKQRVFKNLKTLQDMLASVRTLSRLELEIENLKTQSVPLKKAVEEATSQVLEQANLKKTEIQFDQVNDAHVVSAEGNTLIHNVIPNVLSNAVKFSPVGSTIRLKSTQVGSSVWLSIVDEGSGFADEEIQNFNHGSALQSHRGTAGEKGTGLGLIQVKGFMQLYGGNAVIRNRADDKRGGLVRLEFISG
jgi:signal transduction histidine kinase